MSYSIYKHTCPNGKVYIGLTSRNPEVRWNYGCGYPNNSHFASAIKLYGWGNIAHEVLITGLSKEEATEAERKLIAEYRSTDREKGYNISEGGIGGFLGGHHTEEAKRKISEASKAHGMPESLRRAWKEIAVAKRKQVSVYNTKGELLYDCESICEAASLTGVSTALVTSCCKGRYRQMKGFVFTYKGEPFPKQSHRNIPICQYTKDGKFVKEYSTAKEAAKALGVAQTHITSCCNGKEPFCKGYKFYYSTDLERRS